MVDAMKETRHIREAEVDTVKEIIENRFGTVPSGSNWIVLGGFK
jgi:hypothetical protein